MKTKRTRIAGVVMGLAGVAVLTANAVGYLSSRERSNPALVPIGIMLAVIGAGLVRRGRRTEETSVRKDPPR